jgi:hypothetical protein
VRRAGAANWKLETAIATLERGVGQAADEEKKGALAALLADPRAPQLPPSAAAKGVAR